MTTTTIRVSIQTRNLLHSLASSAGVSMQQVIDRALEIYRRQELLRNANMAYACLREQEEQWVEFQTELRDWDTALADGLAEA
jgi:hypothetical protein